MNFFEIEISRIYYFIIGTPRHPQPVNSLRMAAAT